MCGVAIEVPVKNAHPEPSPGQSGRLVHARDRTENIDGDRGYVGLNSKVDECWALAAVAIRNILVSRSDEFLERRDR